MDGVFFAKNLCFCRYLLAKFHGDADASQTGRVEFKDQADLARIEQQQLVNKIIRILGVTLKTHPLSSLFVFKFSACANGTSMLVGGFNHLEKYEFFNGKDDIMTSHI